MARRLILDTGVLVASERRRTALSDLVEPDDDLVICAVTVAELLTGIELAAEPDRAARAEFLARVLEILPVEPYDVSTAEAHGQLLAHVHRRGAPRGAHDLIIAATALSTRRIIVTTDRQAHFEELPGVACLVLP